MSMVVLIPLQEVPLALATFAGLYSELSIYSIVLRVFVALSH